jgi:hypothetical protein
MQYRQNVMLALQEVLDEILLIFVSFLGCTIAGYTRRPSGRGSVESMSFDITTTVHNPVTQSKPAINLSVMN